MRVSRALFAVSLLLFPQSALADGFKRSTVGGFSIDLDSMDNRASIWRVDDLAGTNALRAKVIVGRISSVGRQPQADFQFSTGSRSAWLRFEPLADSNRLEVTLCVGDVDPQGRLIGCGVTELMVSPLVGEPFYVFAQWNNSGRISIRLSAVENISGSFPPEVVSLGDSVADRPIDWISFSSASAELILEDVQFGVEEPWSN